jgi:hypothetical protein
MIISGNIRVGRNLEDNLEGDGSALHDGSIAQCGINGVAEGIIGYLVGGNRYGERTTATWGAGALGSYLRGSRDSRAPGEERKRTVSSC